MRAARRGRQGAENAFTTSMLIRSVNYLSKRGAGAFQLQLKCFRNQTKGGVAGPDAPKMQALPEWGGV